jgi:hypothetical protein
VDHGAGSCPLEGMGDASPWLNPRCVVNFASDCGVRTQNISPRKYKYSDPLKREVNLKYTGEFNRSICAYHVQHSIVGRRIIEPRSRTPKRLLLVAQGSKSFAEEIFVKNGR